MGIATGAALYRSLGVCLVLLLLTPTLLLSTGAVLAASEAEPDPSYRILHIMSHHSPWRWTDGQLRGFKEGLGEVDAEYLVFQMDAKRASGPDQLEEKGREARALIETWQPDLVYTTDDEAQRYVARHYINHEIPFVFSGVNKDPRTYGLTGSRNHTGVMEHEHFIESVRLLQAIDPGIERLAVVFDDAEMWFPVHQRMRDGMAQLPGVDVVAWDTILTFADYQRKVAAYQETADAIALIGIFNFKDERGDNVPYQEVLRWTAENSALPDLGFWIDRVHYGTLASMTVSEREQGLAAGRMARAILVEGRSPSEIPMAATTKGLPVISLARANRLGLGVPSSLLLSAQVIQAFEWER
ncbi:ABC transporter substrate-binding protein [Billgrantia saliphila]|uniref:ABC transporter substrate-binding protein n=1 Tax=Billgrantia saliphila TaxID=1848458 RepID=UPI0018CC51AA|nr:ABC transporter substrate binding protein [Halomonas saliphila]